MTVDRPRNGTKIVLCFSLCFFLLFVGCKGEEDAPSPEKPSVEKTSPPATATDVVVAPTPTPPPTKPTYSGPGCTLENLRSVIGTRKAEITECYRSAAQKDPSVQGRIELELGINPGGSLDGRRVFKSELPLEVNACIVKSLRGLHFPGEFTQACVIIYPFVFSAGPRQ